MSRCFVEKSDPTCDDAGFAIPGLYCTWLGQVPPQAEEVHLRCGRPSSYTLGGRNFALPVTLDAKEMEEVFLALCAGSVYAHRETLRRGYLALSGGVRVGVAGRYVTEAGVITGVTNITGLCFRLPHRFPGLADGLLGEWEGLCGGDGGTTSGGGRGDGDCGAARVNESSVIVGRGRTPDHASFDPDARRASPGGGILLIGRPGAGKTTLLRELTDRLSTGRRVVAVDTRGEIALGGVGRFLTVLTDCPAGAGLEIAARTLSPEAVVTDEIGREEVPGILACLRLGVPLFASAHGGSVADVRAREGLGEVIDRGAFSLAAVLTRNGEGMTIRTEVLSCCD